MARTSRKEVALSGARLAYRLYVRDVQLPKGLTIAQIYDKALKENLTPDVRSKVLQWKKFLSYDFLMLTVYESLWHKHSRFLMLMTSTSAREPQSFRDMCFWSLARQLFAADDYLFTDFGSWIHIELFIRAAQIFLGLQNVTDARKALKITGQLWEYNETTDCIRFTGMSEFRKRKRLVPIIEAEVAEFSELFDALVGDGESRFFGNTIRSLCLNCFKGPVSLTELAKFVFRSTNTVAKYLDHRSVEKTATYYEEFYISPSDYNAEPPEEIEPGDFNFVEERRVRRRRGKNIYQKKERSEAQQKATQKFLDQHPARRQKLRMLTKLSVVKDYSKDLVEYEAVATDATINRIKPGTPRKVISAEIAGKAAAKKAGIPWKHKLVRRERTHTAMFLKKKAPTAEYSSDMTDKQRQERDKANARISQFGTLGIDVNGTDYL